MLAPGDGEAKPETEPITNPSPRSGRQIGTLTADWIKVFHTSTTVCCQLRRLSKIGDRLPQARLCHRLGYTLPACFAGFIDECPFIKYRSVRRDTLKLSYFSSAIEIVNDTVANQIILFLVDGIALAKRILDLSSAFARIKFSEQPNAVL